MKISAIKAKLKSVINMNENGFKELELIKSNIQLHKKNIEIVLASIPEKSTYSNVYVNSIGFNCNFTLQTKSFKSASIKKLIEQLMDLELTNGFNKISINSNDFPEFNRREYIVKYWHESATDIDMQWGWNAPITITFNAELIEGGSNSCQRVIVGEEIITTKEFKYEFKCK